MNLIQHARFNLNDIAQEPSDEQLDALMEAVATEARKHARAAHERLMVQLRAEMMAVDSLRVRI